MSNKSIFTYEYIHIWVAFCTHSTNIIICTLFTKCIPFTHRMIPGSKYGYSNANTSILTYIYIQRTFCWWVLQHCTGFARLVWGRPRINPSFHLFKSICMFCVFLLSTPACHSPLVLFSHSALPLYIFRVTFTYRMISAENMNMLIRNTNMNMLIRVHPWIWIC